MCAVAPFGHPAMSALRSLSRAVAGSPNRHAGTQDGVYGAASPLPVAGRAFSFRGYALALPAWGCEPQVFQQSLDPPRQHGPGGSGWSVKESPAACGEAWAGLRGPSAGGCCRGTSHSQNTGALKLNLSSCSRRHEPATLRPWNLNGK